MPPVANDSYFECWHEDLQHEKIGGSGNGLRSVILTGRAYRRCQALARKLRAEISYHAASSANRTCEDQVANLPGKIEVIYFNIDILTKSP